MKILLAVVPALLLSACVNPDGTVNSNPKADQVLAYVRTGCGYVPLVGIVTAIINKPNQAVQTAQQIADTVCAAITSAKVGAPIVDGVAVLGKKA